ncbi:Asp/Glu/hydantoin racemase [Geosmithia morbida]|uniref:Asp/Glu/hydantoin racemase n=1 Tax=Geosmithia morbida TaxID=1094350 RepID=A0A9P5CY71_9HYPO|nr:Asp/Glu/hydantoin racemase [Geosmithia morbida]KAF4120063.1 Asp/Glu/hydantoin racemase [Geosmithia morbida]
MASDNDTRILVINPNSSGDMTLGMKTAVDKIVANRNIHVTYYTTPNSSPASINNDEDIKASDVAVYNAVSAGNPKLGEYDGILIACFSVHTLVTRLHDISTCHSITGIFEASISTAQLLLRPHSSEAWGIVTTGKFWEKHLEDGVRSFLGQQDGSTSRNFAGVFSTGLNAGDFHVVPAAEVEKRLRDAATRLFRSGNIKCVVMGCAGMAGLEKIIRSTAVEVLGAEAAEGVYVVDGVVAGVLQLEEMVQCRRVFR